MKQDSKHLSNYELFKFYEKLYKTKKLISNGTAYNRMLHFFDECKLTKDQP